MDRARGPVLGAMDGPPVNPRFSSMAVSCEDHPLGQPPPLGVTPSALSAREDCSMSIMSKGGGILPAISGASQWDLPHPHPEVLPALVSVVRPVLTDPL